MNCVFGSKSGQTSVSRECEGIDLWMDGINPGQCFSEVTLEIQVIGVSLPCTSPHAMIIIRTTLIFDDRITM